MRLTRALDRHDPRSHAKSADGASAFSYPLIFLAFISSAFVPTGTMPGPVRACGENQPVTSIVNAIFDLELSTGVRATGHPDSTIDRASSRRARGVNGAIVKTRG
jgi:hypothetical protein